MNMHDSLKAIEQLHYYITNADTSWPGANKELKAKLDSLPIRELVLYLYEPLRTVRSDEEVKPIGDFMPRRHLTIEALDYDLEPLGYSFIYYYEG